MISSKGLSGAAPDEKNNYKWIALSCTTVGALISVLNGSTMMIALPVITAELHASMATIMWVLMGYMLAITVLVPSIGRFADMVGRKKLYVGGFAVFTLGSLLAGFSQTAIQLLLLRMFQAVGGSLMIANSTAIVTDAFPKNELGKALGINSMIIAVGSAIGPIVGGFLTYLGWRWIFWFNVPFGVLGTIWAGLQLKELAKLPAGQKFDMGGTMLFTGGLVIVLLSMTLGSMSGWNSPLVWGGFLAGLMLLGFFVLVESRVKQPMLDLSLFKNRLLAAAYGSILLNGIARGAVTILLIFYLIGLRNYSELSAGILLTPFALAMMVTSPISGSLSDRYGSRWLSVIGLLVSAAGLAGFLVIQADTSVWKIIVWSVIMGAGSGFFNSPNTNAIMSAVPSQRRGVAAGTRTMMNNAGMVLSIALGLGITASSMTPEAMQRLFTHQGGAGGIAVQGFVSGLHTAFLISLVMSLLAAGVSLLRGPNESAVLVPVVNPEVSRAFSQVK